MYLITLKWDLQWRIGTKCRGLSAYPRGFAAVRFYKLRDSAIKILKG